MRTASPVASTCPSGCTSKPGTSLAGNAGAVWLSVCNLGLTASYWFGGSTSGQTIPAFFNALRWGNVTPSMIFIAEARSNWPITVADQLTLGNYATDLAGYVSRGGGLFVNTQYGTTDSQTHYEFLLKWAPFLKIGVTGNTNLQTPSLTAQGAPAQGFERYDCGRQLAQRVATRASASAGSNSAASGAHDVAQAKAAVFSRCNGM